MNLSINDLSYWERKMYFDNIDFLVVGSGIVGVSCAYHMKKKHPNSKVLIVDKGILPMSASSKNAGFACFGSPSEILSDLRTMDSSKAWETIDKRWRGLKALEEWLGSKNIDLQINGSWDLIKDPNKSEEIREFLPELNLEIKKITNQNNAIKEDFNAKKTFGFEQIDTLFNNTLEGQLDTAKLNLMLLKKMQEMEVPILRGIEVASFDQDAKSVKIETNIGQIEASNLILCTNGFSEKLVPNLNVQPARAQVLITKPIQDLKIKGTFHFDEGYFYFRNVDKRILIGGGRNINFIQENTAEIGLKPDIQNAIEQILKTIVLPNTPYEIDHRWAGIMGVGDFKSPIIKRINSKVCAGVRMGGMGVAIGTLVGKELADLHS